MRALKPKLLDSTWEGPPHGFLFRVRERITEQLHRKIDLDVVYEKVWGNYGQALMTELKRLDGWKQQEVKND